MSIVWVKYDLCLRFNASPRICKYQMPCLKTPNSEPLFERLSSTCNQMKMWTASMTTTRTQSCVFHAARVSSRVVWRLFVVTDDAVAAARGVAICPVAVYHNGCGVVRWCWWWSSELLLCMTPSCICSFVCGQARTNNVMVAHPK